ncbi:CRAL/TRIO domain-containing protein [Penicillium maclennaniae]|uniref:CRAL/TRIO domain-containing protein n=1 Tax=Penicillium maclennaniae TaxID=1343394 RepID=UPI00253F69FF|nr:CRAL/TRIO domain-containing protein [Penicillium maclennaniae]KAJ5674768.1 CRAL/TRIO domain-containing protein [Penicillium maclennaniae]
MDQFKDLCARNGFKNSTRAQNADDTTILRFLRAQRYDVGAAFRQFNHFQTWRREHNIRGFYKNLDVEVYDESRKMYPQWIGRRDNEGRPIYVFQVRQLTKKRLDGYLKMLDKSPRPESHAQSEVPIHLLHLHALYLLQFVFPLVSELPRPDMRRPILSSTHIVDISNVSVFQFWNIRKYLQEASKVATAHYPETLGRVFVVGAPAFFTSVWEAINQWFDPETRSKIFILSASESKSFLLSHINPSDLPKEYGGELEWQWRDQPDLDESARELVDEVYHKTNRGGVFSKGPLIFQGGCIELLGSANGLPRRNAFCRIEKSNE